MMFKSVGRSLRAHKARSMGGCIGLALAAGALTGGPALAATPDTPFGAVTVKPIGIEGNWGERMAAAKYDYNGDGANDVFVAEMADKRVFLLSGKQMGEPSQETNPLRIFKDPDRSADGGLRFGSYISAVNDVTGDGKPDLAVGAIGDGSREVEVGSRWGTVYLFNGATGKLVHTLNNPKPGTSELQQYHSQFGGRIGDAGDLTGDNRSELIVGASNASIRRSWDGQGRAYIFNGATGELHRTLDLPDADADACAARRETCRFGISAQGPGDVDGDGVTDHLVSASYWNGLQGRSYVFSGATGSLIRRLDSPEPEQNQAFFGFQDAAPLSPGDVNNDGRADIYQASFDQDGSAGRSQGKAWVFSGKELAAGDPEDAYKTPLYALDDPTPQYGGQFGWSMDSTDYNKDGTPDLYIGQSPHHAGGGPGGSSVMDGSTGTALKVLDLPESCQQNAALGWSIAAPGDLNGDGDPDFVAGAPLFDIPQGNGTVNQGMVFTFVSDPGSLPTPCTNEDLGVE